MGDGRRPVGPGELAAVVERAGGTARVVDPSGRATASAIAAITHDSQRVRPRDGFVCLRGDRFDGHDFAPAAVADGAAVLVVDHELPTGEVGDTPQIVVDDTRRRLGPIAAVVFGEPSERLVTVGVTGTNGKTTTTHLLAAVFEANGWSCGEVGTLHGPRTTPEAPELQATLAEFADAGRAAAVLEVSSHALALHRVDGTRFDAVVFTNFGSDHLDLHGSPEEYFRAKASLFTTDFAPFGVVNVDDAHGRLLADASTDTSFRVVPYSPNDLDDVEVGARAHAYTWRGTRIEVPIGGRFNVANSLAALTTATELGIPVDVVAAGLGAVEPVPGRFEVVADDDPNVPFAVVVDYAHTPDGLVEVLTSARDVADRGAAVIVVFGCGGDRDHDKRPAMGAVAAELADRAIVTSDNPRHEDPVRIVDDVLAGVGTGYRSRVTTNVDRRAAIGEALAAARRGDVVVIAGKGHEQTQDLGDRIVEFDDRAVARALLEDMQ